MLLEFRPASLLVSRETDDFEALGPNHPFNLTEKEDAGMMCTMPQFVAGAEFEQDTLSLDLLGTAGILANPRFQAPSLGAEAAGNYRWKRNVIVGAHLGGAYFFSPEWYGDADIELDETLGLLVGIQGAIGYDVLFTFSVDYLAAKFDVTQPGEWKASDTELDISGLLVRFGVRGKF